jgi:hypothetical protein
MTYTEPLRTLLVSKLEEFYKLYGYDLNEDDTHDKSYEFARDNSYVSTFSDISPYASDPYFIDAVNYCISDSTEPITYSRFIPICDEALGDLIHDYIISNY